MTEGNRQQDQPGGSLSFDVPTIIAAAHELKSPLALIRQLSLALETGKLSSKQIDQLAERITLTAERSLRLTADLTRSARLEGSMFVLEPVNPVSICEDVAREISPLYHAKGREIRVRNRRHSHLAVANRDLLRRILFNFADNALHYSSSDAPVQLSVVGHGDSIRLGVRDFGPALPTQVWKSFRAGQDIRPINIHSRPESSGLGVYIAAQFADAMGATVGTIRHRDGATFYVDLHASTQMRLL